jgi:hypothetical protein
MANTTPGFDRDLGYLDKFLANLERHAQGLEEPRQSALGRLLVEERARWDQIRAILAGQLPVEANPGREGQVEERAIAAPTGLTVGSLIAR